MKKAKQKQKQERQRQRHREISYLESNLLTKIQLRFHATWSYQLLLKFVLFSISNIF